MGSSSIWTSSLVRCFLLKNLHFLLKNVGFLLKNVGFLLKNVDFLLKNVGFLLKNLHFLLKNVGFLLKNVDFLLKNVGFLIHIDYSRRRQKNRCICQCQVCGQIGATLTCHGGGPYHSSSFHYRCAIESGWTPPTTLVSSGSGSLKVTGATCMEGCQGGCFFCPMHRCDFNGRILIC